MGGVRCQVSEELAMYCGEVLDVYCTQVLGVSFEEVGYCWR